VLKRIACLLTLFLMLAIPCLTARAQSDEKRFEVGGQFSILQVETLFVNRPGFGFTLSENQDHVFGFGGRAGYNFSKYFALEGEVNFFPESDDVKGGTKTQALFGVKAGKRFEKVGLFAKARPGFIRYEKGDYVFASGVVCVLIFPPPLACMNPVARTNFAIDLGGVVELYPSKRTIIRFDAGDTIVRFPARSVAADDPNFGPPGYMSAVPVPPETKHQFQASVGFGFRF
jgi:outer membrane protein with beta-barrel domain